MSEWMRQTRFIRFHLWYVFHRFWFIFDNLYLLSISRKISQFLIIQDVIFSTFPHSSIRYQFEKKNNIERSFVLTIPFLFLIQESASRVNEKKIAHFPIQLVYHLVCVLISVTFPISKYKIIIAYKNVLNNTH